MARVIQLDTDEHQAVQALLPWYVNGTLDEAELDRVRNHLTQCARCQADAAWQERLRPPALVADDLVVPSDVNRDWALLARRLAIPKPAPARRAHALLSKWLAARWFPLAVGVQGVLVLALTFAWLWAPPREEPFHALGAAPPVLTANVLVVFRPSVSEADIRRVLRANHAQLVGGPTATDAYLLRMNALSRDVLDRLRGDAAVLRVESLEGDPR